MISVFKNYLSIRVPNKNIISGISPGHKMIQRVDSSSLMGIVMKIFLLVKIAKNFILREAAILRYAKAENFLFLKFAQGRCI